MSIIVQTAKNAGFIPAEVIAREALRVLRANLGLAQFVRRDTDFSVPQSQGDVITVGYPGTFSARNKNSGQNTVTQRAQGGSKVSLTIDKHRYVDVPIEDAARAFSDMDLLRIYMEPMMIALAEQVEADIAAELMTLTNTLGTAGTDLSDTLLRNANRDLNVRRIPGNERMVAITPKDEMALMGSSALQNYFAWAQAQAVERGEAPPIYGLRPMMSQILPQTGVYRLTFTGGSNAQTFRLIYNGFVTADITFSTTAATLASNIQAALEALADPIAMTGLVSCSGAGSGPWTVDVTFSGAALRYNSALVGTVQDVAGTAYAGAITGAFNGTVTSNNFAIHPEAALFVPRMFAPTPADQGRNIANVVDEESGLTFRLIMDYNMSARSLILGIDMLYGVKRLRDVAGIRLIC